MYPGVLNRETAREIGSLYVAEISSAIVYVSMDETVISGHNWLCSYPD
jgi:hypothetical protein